MLATAAGRIEKEITHSVTTGVKDGMVPGGSERIGGGGGIRCRQTRGSGRTSQAGNHVTNGNSRAHMMKPQGLLLSEHLLCKCWAKCSAYTTSFAPHGYSTRKVFLFPLHMCIQTGLTPPSPCPSVIQHEWNELLRTKIG